MTYQPIETAFTQLFKKYRLRSEIETLSEFGDLLAQEGIVYETSLFSKWQSGERIPKERNVILTIIKLFSKLGGIQNINDANLFLNSLNQKNLTVEENNTLLNYLQPTNVHALTKKPKILFYCSPLAATYDQYNEKIYFGIKNLGYIHLYHEAITHYHRDLLATLDSHESEYYKESKKTLDLIKDADICVFETSYRSIASGYAIHEALTQKKPTILLFYRNNKPFIFYGALRGKAILKSYNEKNITKVIKNVFELLY